jgi:hypothetical protein
MLASFIEGEALGRGRGAGRDGESDEEARKGTRFEKPVAENGQVNLHTY